MVSLFWNLLFFVILISALVTFHELGHFMAARYFGVKIYRFSIGFGPALFKWKGKDGVEYVIAALPIGGYVKMKGEADDFVQQYDKKAAAESEKNQGLSQDKAQVQTQKAAANQPASKVESKLIAETDFAELRTGYADEKEVKKDQQAALDAAEASALGLGVDEASTSAVNAEGKSNDAKQGSAGDSFTDLHWFQRFIVLFAGPFCNILLAFFVFFFLNLLDREYLKPVVGDFSIHSVAAESGLQYLDLVQKIDDQEVNNWQDFLTEITTKASEKFTLTVSGNNGKEPSREVVIDFTNIDFPPDFDVFGYLGFDPFMGEIPMALTIVKKDAPAGNSGLRVGDRIFVIDDTFTKDWRALARVFESKKESEEPFDLYVLRERSLTPAVQDEEKPKGKEDGEEITSMMVGGVEYTLPELLAYAQKEYPNSSFTREISSLNLEDYQVLRFEVSFSERKDDPNKVVEIGVGIEFKANPDFIGKEDLNVFEAFGEAWADTGRMSIIVFKSLEKLVTGDINVRSVSGPVSIARIAGTSASAGFTTFLWVMGVISINIGLFNLLPIPVLDGGQIVYAVYEGITKRKPNEKMQTILSIASFSLLMMIMLLAIFNDLLNL